MFVRVCVFGWKHHHAHISCATDWSDMRARITFQSSSIKRFCILYCPGFCVRWRLCVCVSNKMMLAFLCTYARTNSHHTHVDCVNVHAFCSLHPYTHNYTQRIHTYMVCYFLATVARRDVREIIYLRFVTTTVAGFFVAVPQIDTHTHARLHRAIYCAHERPYLLGFVHIYPLTCPDAMDLHHSGVMY